MISRGPHRSLWKHIHWHFGCMCALKMKRLKENLKGKLKFGVFMRAMHKALNSRNLENKGKTYLKCEYHGRKQTGQFNAQ